MIIHTTIVANVRISEKCINKVTKKMPFLRKISTKTSNQPAKGHQPQFVDQLGNDLLKEYREKLYFISQTSKR